MELIYSPRAIKQLGKIGSAEKVKAKKKILSLKENPLLGKPLKGELAGLRSLKAWPLRIIYTYDAKRKVLQIITIDYRGSVYK